MSEFIKFLFETLGKNKKIATAIVLAVFVIATAVANVADFILTTLGIPH